MSEDERAKKAARAKAMLKKRQAKKAGDATVAGVASPVSERAFSPAPPEPTIEEDKRDLGDVFTKDKNGDTSWLSSLPRAASPPQANTPVTPVPPPEAAPSPTNVSYSPNGNDTHLQVQLATLKSENETLTAELRQLESIRDKLQQAENSLRTEIENFKAKLGQSETINSKLQRSEAALKEEVDSLKVRFTQSEAAKSNLQRTEANLRSENKALKTNLGQLEAAKSTLQQAETSLRTELETLKSTLGGHLETTKTKLQQAEASLEETRRRAQELEDQIEQLRVEKDISIRNEQQTISLLVSEKAALTSELERLGDADARAQESERQLNDEQLKANNLESHLQQIRAELQESSSRNQHLEAQEKELTDKVKEQERQLHLANASLTSTRKEAETHRRRVRDLEEQIQSDDRAERLEASLKNTQERADELEFQLSKLKQNHSELKSERDNFESQARSHRDAEEEWKAKHTELHTRHLSIQEQLNNAGSEKEALVQEKTTLQKEAENARQALVLLQEKLSQAAIDLATNTRHLQAAQNEAKIAHRRAEDAEKMQKDLQEEGTNLMRSLEEMRPKIVELTGTKLELVEKTDDLKRAIQNRDAVIVQLENSVQELQQEKEDSAKKWQDALAQREKERSSALNNETELHKEYGELQEQLLSSLARIRTLEADKLAQQQTAARRQEEIERLTESSSAQTEELLNLRQEVEQRRQDQDEEESFLAGAQNELEALRQELSTKDEEIERLRSSVSTPSRSGPPHSLNDELEDEKFSALKLELSSSQSHIRSLENSLFDAEARSHALVKQVAALEDQLALHHPHPPHLRSFSPSGGAIPSRPSSRGSRPLSLTGVHTSRPSALARSALEQNLPPEIQHKRKTSLSMLKARIDSELAAAQVHAQSNSRALSPVQSISSGEGQRAVDLRPRSPDELSHNYHRSRRPQFLDDSHVFWCSSCRGDLIIL